MPRYYFHTEDGQCYPDDEGTELSDLNAARDEAARILGQMLRDDPNTLWQTRELRLIAETEDHKTAFLIDIKAQDPDDAPPRT